MGFLRDEEELLFNLRPGFVQISPLDQRKTPHEISRSSNGS